MESVIKLRLKIAPEQALVLDGQSRICNWAYNHLLEKSNLLKSEFIDKGNKEAGKTVYTRRGLRNLLPGLKVEYPFLKTVHSSPLKNAALRLSQVIKDYQDSLKGKRKGKATGWPRYRKWSQSYFSLLYEEPGKGFKISGKCLTISCGVNQEGKRIRVSGELEKSLKAFPEAEIRNLRITKSHGVYYGIFTVKRPLRKQERVEKTICLDPNHKNLAYGVDNNGKALEIKNPWFLKVRQRRIDYLKSRRDKCLRKSKLITQEHGKSYWLPSRRWSFFHQKLENEYRKRQEQTKSYLYSICHYLCRNYNLISVGDYTPRGGGINKGMRRSMNNESLIGRFKLTLSWVAQRSGRVSGEWVERNSTKTCNKCGFKHEKSLSPMIRRWFCPECGEDHIRDENAALNGLKQVLQKYQIPGSGHPSPTVVERWALRFNGVGLVLST